MGCHPYDPLTTTNSMQESEMANASHKSRPVVTERFVKIQGNASSRFKSQHAITP